MLNFQALTPSERGTVSTRSYKQVLGLFRGMELEQKRSSSTLTLGTASHVKTRSNFVCVSESPPQVITK